MIMKKYGGKLETNFYWILPFVVGVSKSVIDDKAKVFALHITPLFEIGLNWKY